MRIPVVHGRIEHRAQYRIGLHAIVEASDQAGDRRGVEWGVGDTTTDTASATSGASAAHGGVPSRERIVTAGAWTERDFIASIHGRGTVAARVGCERSTFC